MPLAIAKKIDDLPQAQLDRFLDKFTPEIASLARGCIAKMRARLPGATQMVYDNYNFLVIGFGPSEKASHAIFSIALGAKSVALCFLQGASLPDPSKLLKGSGTVSRNMKLNSPADLDKPAVQKLVAVALKNAIEPIDPDLPGKLIIKSFSAKQRPRRPA